MAYYERHVFLNRRDDGSACCVNHDAERLQTYAKDRVKKLALDGKGKVRVNKAGCLDRCDEGPCIVVYPEGIWYTYVDEHDVDEIVESHLVRGEVVKRLKI